mmetsp:Transcript_30258/g.45578  ORF Transcript_30258/g.45578 Transcript_30258/m.45578 type:complete len:162 (-) Transcript_30258:231-716(-)
MGKRSRPSSSSSSSDSSDSSSSSSEEDKKKKKKKKEKEKDKKKKDKKSKKDKKKKEKKDKKSKKDKKDKKSKKDKKEAEAPVETRMVTVGTRPDAPGVREEREKLLREAAAAGAKIAVPGMTPEVKDSSRFEQAKARLEKLKSSQQAKEAKVGYTVRKPNW